MKAYILRALGNGLCFSLHLFFAPLVGLWWPLSWVRFGRGPSHRCAVVHPPSLCFEILLPLPLSFSLLSAYDGQPDLGQALCSQEHGGGGHGGSLQLSRSSAFNWERKKHFALGFKFYLLIFWLFSSKVDILITMRFLSCNMKWRGGQLTISLNLQHMLCQLGNPNERLSMMWPKSYIAGLDGQLVWKV